MLTGHETPINRTAALVTGRGDNFAFRPDVSTTDSDLPLATKERPENVERDLSGVKFGRLTVIGYSATKKKRWVCRCVCGTYTLRRTETILAAPRDNSCDQCYLLATAKKKEYTRRTGKFAETWEFMR